MFMHTYNVLCLLYTCVHCCASQSSEYSQCFANGVPTVVKGVSTSLLVMTAQYPSSVGAFLFYFQNMLYFFSKYFLVDRPAEKHYMYLLGFVVYFVLC